MNYQGLLIGKICQYLYWREVEADLIRIPEADPPVYSEKQEKMYENYFKRGA